MRNLAFFTEEDEDFIQKLSKDFWLSFQDKKQLEIIASDLRRWDEGCLEDFWQAPKNAKLTGKNKKNAAMSLIKQKWEELKIKPKDYSTFHPKYSKSSPKAEISDIPAENPIMGKCPVASEKTRCCNLQTLDAVINCGYDCSYCSIQTFYHTDKILFHSNLQQNLKTISNSLKAEKRYHIGTGQSSDSLMWDNYNGMLDHLFDFARDNKNVILELKTKSANIDYFLKNDVPANVLTTWSLNPQIIIKNEEHLTASLKQRIDAAAKISSKGNLIGFHFHPIIVYKNWKSDYENIFKILLKEFDPEKITHISFGTLTFIKPVIKELRKRNLKSKILQMPMEEIADKLSYPFNTKKEMFSFAYNAFKPWHDRVFFYLCMEDKRLWQPVFGKNYKNNEDFEKDMIDSYFKKIENLWKKQ